MADNLIHDRGRGPEIRGTRITVYDLVPYFLTPDSTESYIARVHDLTLEQVAAARAYVLQHAETVLSEHMRIEERRAVGNPPEIIEQAKRTHEKFEKFRKWLAQRDQASDQAVIREDGSARRRLPTFKEWLAEQEECSAKES